jgi:hypothetical protein
MDIVGVHFPGFGQTESADNEKQSATTGFIQLPLSMLTDDVFSFFYTHVRSTVINGSRGLRLRHFASILLLRHVNAQYNCSIGPMS